MEKYKVCPSCGTKNGPMLFECISCEADLTGVKITDDETEKMIRENGEEHKETAPRLVRVCDCGAKNPPNARKCTACQEDISDITPTPDTEEGQEEPVSFVLGSLDGQYAYCLTQEEAVLGRENEMSEYLADKIYVSRVHARLSREGDGLFLENLSSTNYTYVNNKRIDGKIRLCDGDEIGLGGTNINGKCQQQAAYFLVRIGACM